MQPLSFDFASAFSSVESPSRDLSAAASGNASATSFSALLQLAQTPQNTAPSASTYNSSTSASAPVQRDDSVKQSSYAKPASDQASTQTSSPPRRKQDDAPAVAQQPRATTPKKSEAAQKSSDDTNSAADSSAEDSNGDTSADTAQGQTANQPATGDKKTKASAEPTAATPGVVLELSQLAAAAPAAPTADAVTLPGDKVSGNAQIIAGTKPIPGATAVNGAKGDASAAAALAAQNAVNETAIAAGPTTAVATDSAAAQILSTTTSQDKQSASAANQSTVAVQAQTTLAASLAGAAAVVAPQTAIATSGATTSTVADTASQTAGLPVTAPLQRNGATQPSTPLANTATGDLTGQMPTLDLSFGSVLDSHAAGAAAKQSTDATAASPNDAKPAAASTVSNVAAETTGQLSQTAVHTNAAAGTTTADGVAQVDTARFVQRVEQAFQSASNQGGSIRLRLSPPDLGTMQIDISVQKGQMTANVQTDTVQARNLLLDNLPALRERLAQHNIKIETFNVDLAGSGSGGMSGQASQYQNPTFQSPASTANRNAVRAAATTTTVDAPTISAANQNGSLNIVI